MAGRNADDAGFLTKGLEVLAKEWELLEDSLQRSEQSLIKVQLASAVIDVPKLSLLDKLHKFENLQQSAGKNRRAGLGNDAHCFTVIARQLGLPLCCQTAPQDSTGSHPSFIQFLD